MMRTFRLLPAALFVAAGLLAIGGVPARCAQPQDDSGNAVTAELVPMIGHSASVTAVAYSPNGRLIASVGIDRSGRIWDGRNGALLTALTGIPQPLRAVGFTADSRTVVTAAQDGSLQWWDAHTGKRLAECAGVDHVTAAAVHPGATRADPVLVATADSNRSIALRRVSASGAVEEIATLQGHAADVEALAFSADGKSLASGSHDGVLKVWETLDGLVRRNFKSHAMPIRSVALSPDGSIVADASDDGDANQWDVATGHPVGSRVQLNTPGEGVGAVALSSNGQLIAAGGRTSHENRRAFAAIWKPNEAMPAAFLVGHEAFVTALAFSPDGTRLVSGSRDHTVRVWSTARGRQIASSSVRVAVTAVAFSPTAPLLASAASDSAIRFWSLKTGELTRILLGHKQEVNAIGFAPNGEQLFSGGADGAVRVWSASDGKLLHTWPVGGGAIRALTVSSSGAMVAVGCKTGPTLGSINVLDAATGAVIKRFDGVPPVKTIAFSPDGATLASGHDSTSGLFADRPEIRLWSLKEGKQIAFALPEKSLTVMALAFSPNGRMLATANDRYGSTFEDPLETLSGEISF